MQKLLSKLNVTENIGLLILLGVVIGLGSSGYLLKLTLLSFLLSHLVFTFMLVPFLAIPLGRAFINNRRKQKAATQKAGLAVKAPLAGFYSKWKEWCTLVFFLDEPKRRRITLISLAAIVIGGAVLPVGRSGSMKSISDVTTGWSLTPMLAAILLPIGWWYYHGLRCAQITKKREEIQNGIYSLAKNALKYPVKRTYNAAEAPFQSAKGSIQIKEWFGLTDPKVFWISAPDTLDASDKQSWNTLQENIETRYPSDTGWHFDFHPNGLGATVMPSTYPMSIIWDGQQISDDPLSFYLGADLDNPGELVRFTFGETSPHLACTGGTGAGKSSTVEAIVAQGATKPMPWSDPNDPIYAQFYIIDPKGPFANRWEGRPNITVVNGTRDTVDEEGNEISGIEAMTNFTVMFTDEMDKRGRMVDDAGVAKWLDLSDEVKRQHRMSPWFIVFDEYLDHTDKITGKSEQNERDNEAREILREKAVLIARKGRSFGFHMMLIAQTANMTLIGSALMRQLIARIIMGNMDSSAYLSFFQTVEVPNLPTTRVVNGTRKGIPGRGRYMNAPGMPIGRMQVFWFGGDENDETLNKYLPRAGISRRGAIEPIADNEINEPFDDLEESVTSIKSKMNTTQPIDYLDDDDEAGTEPSVSHSEAITAASSPDTPVTNKQPSKGATAASPPLKTQFLDDDEVEEHDLEQEAADDEGENIDQDDFSMYDNLEEDALPACWECGAEASHSCINKSCNHEMCDDHTFYPDAEKPCCSQCVTRHPFRVYKFEDTYKQIKTMVEGSNGTLSWTVNERKSIVVTAKNSKKVKLFTVTASRGKITAEAKGRNAEGTDAVLALVSSSID